MKIKILILAFFCLSVYTKAQRTGSVLQTFLNSADYSGIQSYISPLGSVSVEESNVKYYDQDPGKPVINIVIRNLGKLTGIVEVLPIPTRFENVLPNNSHYAMQLVDYSNYDVSTKSGTIKTVDLNYDQYTAAVLDVNQTSINRFIVYPMPAETKAKYNYLKKINEINSGTGPAELPISVILMEMAM